MAELREGFRQNAGGQESALPYWTIIVTVVVCVAVSVPSELPLAVSVI
jgi:hypothetical protein